MRWYLLILFFISSILWADTIIFSGERISINKNELRIGGELVLKVENNVVRTTRGQSVLRIRNNSFYTPSGVLIGRIRNNRIETSTGVLLGSITPTSIKDPLGRSIVRTTNIDPILIAYIFFIGS